MTVHLGLGGSPDVSSTLPTELARAQSEEHIKPQHELQLKVVHSFR
jgi:hypothetical protein